MSTERRGTRPDHPDFRHGSTAGPAGPPPEHTEHDIDRIAAERSREEEVLRSHPRPSLWSRLVRRHRYASIPPAAAVSSIVDG